MGMKNRLVYAFSILFLTMFACTPSWRPLPQTLSTMPPAVKPPAAVPTELASPLPPNEAPSPTVEEPTTAPPEPSPLPASPQEASTGHFRAGSPIQLDEIHMTSTTAGWGISGPYVLTTSDGGQTWQEATPPDPLLAGGADHAYGGFLDAQTAWVVFSQGEHIPMEASVWHTTDGGRTWTPAAPLLHQVVGDSVWAEFSVLDARHIWILVRGVYVGAGTHFNHELFRTVDGGSSWTSLDGEISDDYTGMVFRDPQNGVRTLQTTGAYAAAPPAFDITSDGGATWENRELPPPTDAPDLFTQYPYCETYQPDLYSTTFIRMLVGCFDYYSPPKQAVSYVYASFDNGKTWSIQLLPSKVVAPEYTLLFFGAYPTLLLGREMYSNSNGGFGDWTDLKTVSWRGKFSFVDPENGWAVATSDAGEVALVHTTNGGSSWSVIQPTCAKK